MDSFTESNPNPDSANRIRHENSRACGVDTTLCVCCRQIRAAASGLELTEEQFVELQSQHWARFYSICVQYQQVPQPSQSLGSSNNGMGWLGTRVVSMLDSGTEGPGFKSQPQRCRLTVLGKLFTPIVPVFIKQRNW